MLKVFIKSLYFIQQSINLSKINFFLLTSSENTGQVAWCTRQVRKDDIFNDSVRRVQPSGNLFIKNKSICHMYGYKCSTMEW